MVNQKFKKDKGFTLIELLVGLAISAFVILAAYSFVMVGTKNYDTTSKTTTLQQEMTFTSNLLGESIRAGKKEVTSITCSGNNIEIHTGNKVFYYDNSKTSLYVYNDIAPVGDSSYKACKDENLVSKYITSFETQFVSTDSSMTEPTFPYSSTQTGFSNLIKVKITADVKGKEDTSEIIYQIRNNS